MYSLGQEMVTDTFLATKPYNTGVPE